MNDLFLRLRPKSLKEIVGHERVLNILKGSIKNNSPFSFILWGPPGVGKTSIAYAFANELGLKVFRLNATFSGVKELKEIINKARNEYKLYNKPTVLLIDEIHRYNKSQQPALLEPIESGYIILIGTTTENPTYEIIPPLISRCRVFRLYPLNKYEIKRIIRRVEGELGIKVEKDAKDFLIEVANGDARVVINVLEDVFNLKGGNTITLKDIENLTGTGYKFSLRERYDSISALIKSVRGSDPDAALYYLVRLLEKGEDPKYIMRRMVILASEDIGNAEPLALILAVEGFKAVEIVGMPEAKIIMAQVITYLSSAPKSNASYKALQRAEKDFKNHPNAEIPENIKLYPKGYKYPHDFGGFVNQNYKPKGLEKSKYYKPSDVGYEKEIRERLNKLWEENSQ